MEENRFYISLSEDATDKSIPALLLHALKQLKDDVGKKEFELVHFNLVRPYASGDLPSMYIEYDLGTDEASEIKREALDNLDASQLANDMDLRQFAIPHEKGLPLNAVTVRMPQGPGQFDNVLLIEAFAITLRELQGIQILDIVYHSYLDENVLQRPNITAYYSS